MLGLWCLVQLCRLGLGTAQALSEGKGGEVTFIARKMGMVCCIPVGADPKSSSLGMLGYPDIFFILAILVGFT